MADGDNLSPSIVECRGLLRNRKGVLAVESDDVQYNNRNFVTNLTADGSSERIILTKNQLRYVVLHNVSNDDLLGGRFPADWPRHPADDPDFGSDTRQKETSEATGPICPICGRSGVKIAIDDLSREERTEFSGSTINLISCEICGNFGAGPVLFSQLPHQQRWTTSMRSNLSKAARALSDSGAPVRLIHENDIDALLQKSAATKGD